MRRSSTSVPCVGIDGSSAAFRRDRAHRTTSPPFPARTVTSRSAATLQRAQRQERDRLSPPSESCNFGRPWPWRQHWSCQSRGVITRGGRRDLASGPFNLDPLLTVQDKNLDCEAAALAAAFVARKVAINTGNRISRTGSSVNFPTITETPSTGAATSPGAILTSNSWATSTATKASPPATDMASTTNRLPTCHQGRSYRRR